MKRKTDSFDISKAIRHESYTSPSGNKQKVYIFNCLDCKCEFGKTAYYAKNCTGYCKFCAPKYTHSKEVIDFEEKECNKCNFIKKKEEFSFTATKKHKKQTCIQCINLLSNFGITSKEYTEMLESQNGKCAICNNPESHTHQNGKISNLAVDHCHKTGKIRGLLCSNCNIGLGNLKDDKKILISAINYLEKNNES